MSPNQTYLSPAFTDPYTARLVKLRNILLLAGTDALPQSGGNSGPGLSGSARPTATRPTFDEMMAIVNRPRRRRG